MTELIINDGNKWIQINKGKNGKISGFTGSFGIIGKIKSEDLDILKLFRLSDSNIYIGNFNNYDIFYDKISGLKHYFKNGIEDLEELYKNNGIPFTKYLKKDNNYENNYMKKFIILGISIIITFNALTINLINKINEDRSWKTTVLYNNESALLTYNPLDGIELTYDNSKITIKKEVDKDILKNLILESNALNEQEKNFIFNEKLYTDVVPYYLGNNPSIISQIRHLNMDIVPINLEENYLGLAGIYHGDNLIHINNYVEGTLKDTNNSDTKREIGHERIHLLQMNSEYSFILETSAEIMAHEYDLLSSDLSIFYSYNEECNILKVLMEIIGPNVIMDYNFNYESKLFEDTIKSLLNEEDANYFLNIMKLSPAFNKEELKNNYEKIYELLKIMYYNKFGSDIKNNKMICNIIFNVSYNRPYFNSNLIDRKESYYTDYYIINENELKDKFYFYKYESVSKEEYYAAENETLIYGYTYYIDGSMKILKTEFSEVLLLTNEGETFTIDIKEAEANGYIKPVYMLPIKLSIDEYKKGYKNNEDVKMITSLNNVYYSMFLDEFVCLNVDNKIHTEEITDIDSLKLQLS